MGLIDKNQVEDIKRTVTEKVDEYKKEINKGNKLKSFELALEIENVFFFMFEYNIISFSQIYAENSKRWCSDTIKFMLYTF